MADETTPPGRMADHVRPWKRVQREFHQVEEAKLEVAEQLKKGIPVDGATYEDAQPVLRAVTENVLLEVQKTLEFFKAAASVDHIDRVVLSGGASRIEELRERLQERLQAPVEHFDPFKVVAWDARKLGGTDAADVSATAAVAVGLALRQVGDR